MGTIFIDPGHGGRDSGAVGNGLLEKEISLRLALLTGELVKSKSNLTVHYSRTSDVFVPLNERIRLANASNAALFISFHSNGFASGSAFGYEDFISPGASKSTIILRDGIHQRVSNIWFRYGSRNRGKKHADFFVLRRTRMPAILVENGFLTNKKDASLLKDSQFVRELAEGFAEGIINVLMLP